MLKFVLGDNFIQSDFLKLKAILYDDKLEKKLVFSFCILSEAFCNEFIEIDSHYLWLNQNNLCFFNSYIGCEPLVRLSREDIGDFHSLHNKFQKPKMLMFQEDLIIVRNISWRRYAFIFLERSYQIFVETARLLSALSLFLWTNSFKARKLIYTVEIFFTNLFANFQKFILNMLWQVANIW